MRLRRGSLGGRALTDTAVAVTRDFDTRTNDTSIAAFVTLAVHRDAVRLTGEHVEWVQTQALPSSTTVHRVRGRVALVPAPRPESAVLPPRLGGRAVVGYFQPSVAWPRHPGGRSMQLKRPS